MRYLGMNFTRLMVLLCGLWAPLCLSVFAEEAPVTQVPREALNFSTIKQNEIGYHPKAPKVLWVKLKSDSFMDSDSDNPVVPHLHPVIRNPEQTFFDLIKLGRVVSHPFVDPISTDLSLLDLSRFNKVGTFRLYPFGQWIQAQNLSDSTRLTVSPNVFQWVGQAATRALYSQRSGQILLDGSIGLFQEAGHLEKGLPVGGWYEGATYDRHLLSHVMVTTSLMTMYERNPIWSQKRGRLAYPKSEDLSAGVPEILHEARHGLRWILAMQDPATKAFYTGIGAPSPFDGKRLKPEQDKDKRQLLAPSQLSTAAAVATLAQAARVYQTVDPDLSLEALMAAQAGWKSLMSKRMLPSHVTLPWPTQAVGASSTYRESFWSQALPSVQPYFLWAALELGHSTHNEKLLAFAATQWEHVAVDDLSWYSPLWRLWTHPVLKDDVPEGIQAHWLKNADISRTWSRALETPLVSPFEFKEFPALPASNDGWVRHALFWMDAYDRTKDDRYLNAALDVFNYLMGFNQWDVIMMSGNPALADLPFQEHPCNQVARGAKAPLPGLLLKGVTPDFPVNLPFQDNSSLCQWSATHISWQGHLAELMFRLDQHYSPELAQATVIKSTDKDIQKLKLYREVEEEELQILEREKQKRLLLPTTQP